MAQHTVYLSSGVDGSMLLQGPTMTVRCWDIHGGHLDILNVPKRLWTYFSRAPEGLEADDWSEEFMDILPNQGSWEVVDHILGWLQDICTNGEHDIPLLTSGDNLQLYITALYCKFGRATTFLLEHLETHLLVNPFLDSNEIYNLRFLPDNDPLLKCVAPRISSLPNFCFEDCRSCLLSDPRMLYLVYEANLEQTKHQTAEERQQEQLKEHYGWQETLAARKIKIDDMIKDWMKKLSWQDLDWYREQLWTSRKPRKDEIEDGPWILGKDNIWFKGQWSATWTKHGDVEPTMVDGIRRAKHEDERIQTTRPEGV
ncbi:uncharacterized protein BDZ99DRAFT_529112 [Mytilinidion resinicola]|uniref:Uncharacterized protein n=1 Tax=Mytilinidion resinicola TaxID=574789 RepID=A0A6A6Z8E4_9PEZI|nr:uncharacterized protein BDZ99DRAFT_529112 [Mytilinidion resinicola]KAF2817003.1 hypothetical protein BDZ99DRAFT_529112 [Mytilinidion resinicola]